MRALLVAAAGVSRGSRRPGAPRALLVAGKQLREFARQPRSLLLSLGLPVAFMLIFGLAFGSEDGTSTYHLAVADQDGGELAAAYVRGLQELAYDDGQRIFLVTKVADAEAARADLELRDVDGILAIPSGFSEGLTPTQQPAASPLQPAQTSPPAGSTVTLTGDPSYASYAAVSAIVDAYSRGFGEQAARQPAPLKVEREAATSAKLETFDFIAPGLMIFAILNLAPQAASMLAREVELGTLDRLRQSPAGALNVLGGVALAQLVLASASLALMLAAASLMGFHNQGSWSDAYAIALVAGLAVIGLGMVIAAFARTQQEAANFGILVAVPGSFLSGAFFAIPTLALFTLDGRVVGVYHLLPTTWAVEAMRQVLTFGRPLADVSVALAALAVLSALFLTAGALLYRRTRLAPA